MSALWRALRNHFHFLLIALVLTIIMTWPTAAHVFDTSGFWLPDSSSDIFKKIWDAWHGRQALAGLTEFNHTYAQFYPGGMSLVYHPYNILHMLLLTWLQALMPVVNAYNFIYLTFVFATALSAYLFLLYWLGDKWLALFGAVIFGFSQHVVGHAHQPDIGLLATIPLALYAMHRGVMRNSRGWMAAAGVLVGATVFVGVYVFICLLLTVGTLSLYFALSRWRQLTFWIGLAVMLMIAGSISVVRIYPVLRDRAEFADALDKTGGRESANDLLASFVNYRHPLTTPLFIDAFDIKLSGGDRINGWRHTSYLGYLSLLLALLALMKSRNRRQLLPWLLLFGFFFVLRLGSELRVNDVMVPGVRLPKYYLDRLLPPLFEAIHTTDHFQMGLLLPLAMLSAAGLRVISGSAPRRYRAPIILLATAVVAFEGYCQLMPLKMADENFAFNTWLESEPDQDALRLINLPMGRLPSKHYALYQSLNGYPQAEGVAMRTPPSSYDYIHGNKLLDSWSKDPGDLACAAGDHDAYFFALDELIGDGISHFDDYLFALNELRSDGFSHIALHSTVSGADKAKKTLEFARPAYQDEYVAIYRLSEVYDSCADIRNRFESDSAHLWRFEPSSIASHPSKSTLIIWHGNRPDSDALSRISFSWFSEWGELAYIHEDDEGRASVQSSWSERVELEGIAAKNRVVWVAYHAQDGREINNSNLERLAPHVSLCERHEAAQDLTILLHIDRDFPCALITSGDPFAVRYDNGIQLANILHNLEDKLLAWYLWWSDEPVRGFAYTIQLFDASGEKVLQLDDVIQDEPLAQHAMDLSGLEAGEYRADLIVYGHESGRSQPGTVLSSGQVFQRELEIARFALED